MSRESITEASSTEVEAQVEFELEMYRNPRMLKLLKKSNPTGMSGLPDPIGLIEATVTTGEVVARAGKLTCTKQFTQGFWCEGLSGATKGVTCCAFKRLAGS